MKPTILPLLIILTISACKGQNPIGNLQWSQKYDEMIASGELIIEHQDWLTNYRDSIYQNADFRDGNFYTLQNSTGPSSFDLPNELLMRMHAEGTSIQEAWYRRAAGDCNELEVMVSKCLIIKTADQLRACP